MEPNPTHTMPEYPAPPVQEAPASIFTAFFIQAVLFVFLFLALVYDTKELVLFCLLVLFLGMVTYLWSRTALRGVECKIRVDRPRLFPGDTLTLTVAVDNHKLLPVLVKVSLPFPDAGPDASAGEAFDGRMSGDPWMSGEAVVSGYGDTLFSTRFRPAKRGVYNLGSPFVGAGDLFGFYSNTVVSSASSEVVVYPRIVPIRPVDLPKREFYGIPGGKSPVEDPVYVYGTREYQPSSPARRIHWKASARHNRLQEKICEPSEQEKALLLLDVDGFQALEAKQAFESVLEIMASSALLLDRRGVSMGFATNGAMKGKGRQIVPVSKDPLSLTHILESLARVTMKKTRPITDLLARGYPIQGGISVLGFTLGKGEETEALEAFMRHRRLPMRLVTVQKTEAGEPSESVDHILL